MKEIDAIKQALAAGPTPGPWFSVQPEQANGLPVQAMAAAALTNALKETP